MQEKFRSHAGQTKDDEGAKWIVNDVDYVARINYVANADDHYQKVNCGLVYEKKLEQITFHVILWILLGSNVDVFQLDQIVVNDIVDLRVDCETYN